MVVQVIEDGAARAQGRIDGLVNNAGGQYRTAMKTISTKGFEAVVRSNLTGGFIFMRETYNRWMEAHGGAIVNIIADIWGGWPDYAHSGAARGGMLTLSETAACEWATSGVRVNCVAPSGIASSGFDTYTPEAKAKILEFPPHGAAAALRHRGRNLVGHRLPAVAGGVLHHGLVRAGGRRHAELQAHLLEAAAGCAQ
jgi:citronellol/citronellal dehydrogenase